MRLIAMLPVVLLAGCDIQPPPPSIADASSDKVVIYSAVRNDAAATERASSACAVHGREARLVESYRTGLGDEVRYLFGCVEG